jgi:hypothetical protein
MLGAAQLIVAMWMAPVIMFVLIPLMLFCGWQVISLLGTIRRVAPENAELSERVVAHGA